MGIVIDASTLLSLAFDDEELTYGQAVVRAIRDETARSSLIFWFELRNALVVNECRGRITADRTAAFLDLVHQLPIEFEPLPSDSSVLDLSRRFALSVYDASYLEIGIRTGQSLATLDQPLRKAAKKAKVAIFSAA